MLKLTAALLVVLPLSWEQAAYSRVLTIEDVLHTEEVDRAFIISGGSRVLFEYSGPWNDLPDPGITGGPSDRLGASIIYLTSVGQAHPAPIFAPAAGAGYWVDSVSPSGRRVALSWLKHRHQFSGVFDLITRRLTTLNIVPYLAFQQIHPVWISDHDLVYAAQTRGVVSAAFFNPVAVKQRQASMWDRSWAGRQAAVTTLSSGLKASEGIEPLGDGKLVRVDAITGSAATMDSGTFTSLVVSPGRRFVAALRIGGYPQGPDVMNSDLVDQRSAQLRVYDLAHAGAPISVCEECNVAPGTIQWSADGHSLIAFERVGRSPWETGRFIYYDLLNQQLRFIECHGIQVVSEGERWAGPRPEPAAWIGGKLVVYARKLPEGSAEPGFLPTTGAHPRSSRADWYTVSADGVATNLTGSFGVVDSLMLSRAADSIFVLADGDVWEVSSDGSRRNITHSGGLRQVRLRVGASGSRDFSVLYRDQISLDDFAVRSEDGRTLFVVDPTTRACVRLEGLGPDAAILAATAKGGGSAILYSRSSAGTDLIWLKAAGTPVLLRRINAYLGDVQAAPRIPIYYTVSGEKLQGCVELPLNWDPQKSYPLIVSVYPNRTPACKSGRVSHWFDELLTAKGYVYFEPQTPQKLIRTPSGPADHLAEVVLAGVDEAIQEGYGDSSRMGLIGESQGGLYAPWLLTRTNRFKAAVAIDGLSDLASDYGELSLPRDTFPEEFFSMGSSGRYETDWSDEYLGANPWDAPDVYVRNSPYFQAGKITTPLMLVQTDLDYFPLSQFEELFTALYRQGKPAALIRYWGEEHVLRSPANVRDRWERVKNWFDEYLR